MKSNYITLLCSCWFMNSVHLVNSRIIGVIDNIQRWKNMKKFPTLLSTYSWQFLNHKWLPIVHPQHYFCLYIWGIYLFIYLAWKQLKDHYCYSNDCFTNHKILQELPWISVQATFSALVDISGKNWKMCMTLMSWYHEMD